MLLRQPAALLLLGLSLRLGLAAALPAQPVQSLAQLAREAVNALPLDVEALAAFRKRRADPLQGPHLPVPVDVPSEWLEWEELDPDCEEALDGSFAVTQGALTAPQRRSGRTAELPAVAMAEAEGAACWCCHACACLAALTGQRSSGPPA